jgi:uncharacterized protein YyaL (SSP411 family)
MNLVNWQPWDEEVWAKAQSVRKLLIISIGYEATLGCQKMEQENFQNPFIVDLMNRHFICVKVNRYEDPVLDRLALDVAQMLTPQGGWPLHLFCLPNGQPFFAGTYFPSKDLGDGIIPWPQLLMRVHNHFQNDPKGLAENAEGILKNLQHLNEAPLGEAETMGTGHEAAIDRLLQTYDQTHWGWGGPAKFPCGMILEALMASAERYPQKKHAMHCLVHATLHKIATSELWDAENAGFFLYAKNQDWKEPHQEKGLAENALLLRAYAQAQRLNTAPLYNRTMRDTFQWVKSTLKGECFYSAGWGEGAVEQHQTFQSNAMWATTLFDMHNLIGDDVLKEAETLAGNLMRAFGLRGRTLKDASALAMPYNKGYLGDWVAMLELSLKLVDHNPKGPYREDALHIMDEICKKFKDPEGVGFFETAQEAPTWLIRRKVWLDTTLPAPQAWLLKLLGHPLLQLRFKEEREFLQKIYLNIWKTMPNAVPYSLIPEIP